MKAQNQQKQYEQISFNKQCTEDQTNQNVMSEKPNKKSQQNQLVIEKLTARVAQLQRFLTSQKVKSSQLQKRNQQLTDMLVSASQSSVKRNEHFIRQVERKICNFKAFKDLSSSSFRPLIENQRNQNKIRMMTEQNYQSTRRFSSTHQENFISKGKIDNNKENTNSINQKVKTEIQKFSKSKYIFTNNDPSILKQKGRVQMTKEFQPERKKYKESNEFTNPARTSPILNPFAKGIDTKIFDKLQHKMMRM